MCWSPNTPTICRSIARARSSSVRGWTSTVRRWPTGSASPPRFWNLSPMPSGGMCWQDRRSSRTIPRSRCLRPAPERPQRRGCGPMGATSGLGMATPLPPAGIASRPIGRASTRRIISQVTGAGCTPMATPGSRTSIGPATSTRSPAWPMSGASLSTSTGPRDRPSPTRPSGASRSSMPSRRRHGDRRRTDVSRSARRKRRRSSTAWNAGCTSNCRRSPASRRWPWQSGMA